MTGTTKQPGQGIAPEGAREFAPVAVRLITDSQISDIAFVICTSTAAGDAGRTVTELGAFFRALRSTRKGKRAGGRKEADAALAELVAGGWVSTAAREAPVRYLARMTPAPADMAHSATSVPS